MRSRLVEIITKGIAFDADPEVVADDCLRVVIEELRREARERPVPAYDTAAAFIADAFGGSYDG